MDPRRRRRRNARAARPLACRAFVPAILTAVLAVTSAACDASLSSVTTGASVPKCQLTTTASTVGAEGGTGTVNVTTNPECAWNATSQAGWISLLSPSSGQGSGAFEFRAEPNPLPSAREADIAVNEERVRITQQAAPCRFTLAASSEEFGVSGGNGKVDLTGPEGCAWSATSHDSWIVITSVTSGRGNGSVAFTVAANSGGQRQGSMTIADRSITVTQSGTGGTPPPPPPAAPTLPPCTYAIDRTSYTLAPSAGSVGPVVNVSSASHCEWTARSNVSWMSITSGASGKGNGSVTFTVAPNSGPARTGTLSIAGKEFTVSQAPAPAFCGYNIDPTSALLPSGGGTGSIDVSAAPGCPWVAVPSSSWIVITSGGGGGSIGGGSASFSAGPNTGPPRSGSITIAGLTFAITQEGD